MTSHELARKLLEIDDVMVTVRGYEDGVDEITVIDESRDLHLEVYKEWYYGKHAYNDIHCEYGCTHKIVKAINLR